MPATLRGYCGLQGTESRTEAYSGTHWQLNSDILSDRRPECEGRPQPPQPPHCGLIVDRASEYRKNTCTGIIT